METIVLEVPSNIAKQFNGLSVSEKKFYVDLFERMFLSKNRIEKERQQDTIAMLELMDDISRTAIERGLTEEIFNDILKEALSHES